MFAIFSGQRLPNIICKRQKQKAFVFNNLPLWTIFGFGASSRALGMMVVMVVVCWWWGGWAAVASSDCTFPIIQTHFGLMGNLAPFGPCIMIARLFSEIMKCRRLTLGLLRKSLSLVWDSWKVLQLFLKYFASPDTQQLVLSSLFSTRWWCFRNV